MVEVDDQPMLSRGSLLYGAAAVLSHRLVRVHVSNRNFAVWNLYRRGRLTWMSDREKET